MLFPPCIELVNLNPYTTIEFFIIRDNHTARADATYYEWHITIPACFC